MSGHYHLHDDHGNCDGDTAEFEDACLQAAQHMYPWCVPDNDPIESILTVIDAPFCIDVCKGETDVQA